MDPLGGRGPPSTIPETAARSLSYGQIAGGTAIGRGGNADVFRVTVPTAGSTLELAVKEPRVNNMVQAAAVERMLADARTKARDSGTEFIVSVIDERQMSDVEQVIADAETWHRIEEQDTIVAVVDEQHSETVARVTESAETWHRHDDTDTVPTVVDTLHSRASAPLMEEAETWQRLDSHDHIVSVVDYDDDPTPWIAMEYMDTGHLGAYTGLVDFDQALWIGVCVCNAVNYAHRYGVAHHDIKPANVLLTSAPDGWAVPKVSDWGLARLMIEETGSVDGLSPQYAAPEQFDAERYGSPDDRTDIYQVGTLLYELVTGHPPFEGSTTAVMQDVLSTEPPSPSEVADVPTEFDEALRPALEKDPDDRYESILYLRDALQDLFDEYHGDASTEGDRTSPGVAAGGSGSAADDSARVDDSSADRHRSAVEGPEEEPAERNPEHSAEAESGTAESETVDADDAESRVTESETVESNVVKSGTAESDVAESETADSTDSQTAESETRRDDRGPSPGDSISGGQDPPGPESTDQQREQGGPAGDSIQHRTLLLGGLGVVALVVLLAVLGTVLGTGLPFVSGGGGTEAALELDTAELRGADGILIEGQMRGAPVDDTQFTVQVWDGEQDSGEPVLTRQLSATDTGDGVFSIAVDPEGLDVTAEEYEVVVEATEGASASATLEPGPVEFVLESAEWTEGALAVTGSLTQSGVGLPGEPGIEVTVDGETVTPTFTYGDNGTVEFSISDNQTARDLTSGGDVTITAAYESIEDTITAQRPESTGSAVFEVTVTNVSTPVVAGETVSVTAKVTNIGEAEDTQSVALGAGDLGGDDATVSLSGQESTSETLTVDTGADDAGEYSLTVASENSSDTAAVMVEPEPTGPLFQIGIPSDERTVTAGEALTVTVEVANTGDEPGTETVALDAGELGTDSTEVTLEANDTTNVTLSVSTETGDAGEYTPAVDSESDQDTVSVTVESDTDTNDGDGTEGGLNVQISSITEPVTVGEDVSVTVAVTNTDDTDRTETVEVDAEALGSESVEVSLTAGESTDETFTFETGQDDAGLYDVTVSSADSTSSEIVTVDAPGEPSFQVTVVGVTTSAEGNSVGVTFTVENTGGSPGSGAIALTTEPTLDTASVEVALGPGESTEQTVAIATEQGDAGEYTVTVESNDDADSEPFTIVPSQSAFFDVTILGVSSPVAEGGIISVTAEVENTGDVEDTQTVTLDAGAFENKSREVTVPGGEFSDETFTIETSDGDAGEYDISVFSDDDTDSETVTVTAGGFSVSIQETNSPTAGNDIEVTAQITNTGGGTASQTVEATTSIGSDQTTVELAAGASTTETFSISTGDGDSGEYNVTVSSDDSSNSETVTVVGVFTVEIVDINTNVSAGGIVGVQVSVTNTGIGATKTVTLDAGDLGSDSIDVTLDGNASTTEELSVMTSEGDAGNYIATVSTEGSIASINVTVIEQSGSALSASSTAVRSADAVLLRDTGTDAPGWSSARATDAPKTLEPIAGAYSR